jgi:hypothetical protein
MDSLKEEKDHYGGSNPSYSRMSGKDNKQDDDIFDGISFWLICE